MLYMLSACKVMLAAVSMSSITMLYHWIGDRTEHDITLVVACCHTWAPSSCAE